MTVTGMRLYALSFLRTLVIQVAAVCLLPVFFDLNGIWLATAAAEIVTLSFSVWMLLRNRRKYGY